MPKVLWVSPYSLHDVSSSAAIQCRCMLESLQSRGYDIWALSSFVFNRAYGSLPSFGSLNELYAQNPQMTLLELDDRNIHYIYLKNRSILEPERTMREQEDYYLRFLEALKVFKPDLIMGYGTGIDSRICFAEAQRQGIPTVYVLLNAHHANFTFPHANLVITDSHFTSDVYAQRDHINCLPLGEFINPKQVVAKERNPLFVTLINADFPKGLSIFAKLAERCQQELPNLKFLVINADEKFAQNLTKLHKKDEPHTHPYTAVNFPNILTTKVTHDIRLIYAQTKVALQLNLTSESWGRVASEALLNNIPVLGSALGGVPEAVGAGGIVLTPPEHCLRDHASLPTDEEIQPWVEALKRLLNEDWQDKIKEAVKAIELENQISRLQAMLEPLMHSRGISYAHRHPYS